MSQSQNNAPAPVADTQASGEGLESNAFVDEVDAELQAMFSDDEDGQAPHDDEASDVDASDDTPDDASDEEGTGEDSPADDDGDGQEADESASSPPEAPAGWGKGAKELFAKLPPEVQAEVSRRETEREQFVNAKAQEAAEFKTQRDLIAQKSCAMLAQGLLAAKIAVEGEYSGVDWNKIQQEDPLAFLQLSGKRQERMQAVEQIMQAYGQQEQAVREQAEKQEVERWKVELEAVKPKIAGMLGDKFEPKGYVTDISAYLSGLGAPQEHIAGITHGYQLEIATKAMLYDRGAKAREKAAKQVAAAPKVQGVKGGMAQTEQSKTAKGLREKFRKDPGNMDVLTDLLMAEQP